MSYTKDCRLMMKGIRSEWRSARWAIEEQRRRVRSGRQRRLRAGGFPQQCWRWPGRRGWAALLASKSSSSSFYYISSVVLSDINDGCFRTQQKNHLMTVRLKCYFWTAKCHYFSQTINASQNNSFRYTKDLVLGVSKINILCCMVFDKLLQNCCHYYKIIINKVFDGLLAFPCVCYIGCTLSPAENQKPIAAWLILHIDANKPTQKWRIL